RWCGRCSRSCKKRHSASAAVKQLLPLRCNFQADLALGRDNMAETALPDRILDLRALLDRLVEAGPIEQEDANGIAGAVPTREQSTMHPLAYIASQQLSDRQRPGKVLDLDRLTEWLAE